MLQIEKHVTACYYPAVGIREEKKIPAAEIQAKKHKKGMQSGPLSVTSRRKSVVIDLK